MMRLQKQKKATWRSLGVSLIMVVILAGSIVGCLTACKVPVEPTASTAPVVADTKNLITETELIQLMAEAIDGSIDLATAYRAIPANQREALTEDEFQRYIRFLRRGVSSAIVSFAPMTVESLDSIRDQIINNQPSQR
ncbi:MAG: hypothetical protein PHC86_08875, partial [Eubacteriales bacterium]|nr:hypothetical protein [Eubacteriales bacterium]